MTEAMLHDPARHEPLRPLPWDEGEARAAVTHIVLDTEARFTEAGYWPLHPLDAEGDEAPGQIETPLYDGACGVFWALHHLQDVGAVTLSRSYFTELDRLLTRNRVWLGASVDRAGLVHDGGHSHSADGLRRGADRGAREIPRCADRREPRSSRARADVGRPGDAARRVVSARANRGAAMGGAVPAHRGEALDAARVVNSAPVLVLDTRAVWPAVDLPRRGPWIRGHGLAVDPRSAPPGRGSVERVGALHRHHRAAHRGSPQRSGELAPSARQRDRGAKRWTFSGAALASPRSYAPCPGPRIIFILALASNPSTCGGW